MKTTKGLTLVETLIAITLFGVLSAATAGLMLSSINLRSGNQRSLQAEHFVNKVLEEHKDYWSVLDNYDKIPDYVTTGTLGTETPESMSINISYSCMDADGNFLDEDSSALNCVEPSPALRRVAISIYQGENLVAQHVTDIGRPIARSDED